MYVRWLPSCFIWWTLSASFILSTFSISHATSEEAEELLLSEPTTITTNGAIGEPLLRLEEDRDLRLSSSYPLFSPGSLVIIPEDNRTVFYEAFASAKKEIRIEICVLEDPDILQSLQTALERGVQVRVIVDNGKYQSLTSEQEYLATYLTDNGGELHLSNPIFPRSFPKVILIDHHSVLVGSACLDSTTFASYRDYIYVSKSRGLIKDLSRLFENDWVYTRPPGGNFPIYNPTPPFKMDRSKQELLMISPVNSAAAFVSYLQSAKKTIDITSELLGNPTLESELAAAVTRGVHVRLISPLLVNGASYTGQQTQNASFVNLTKAGIDVHVTVPPETLTTPYMHARSAIVDDGKGAGIYIGSISLSDDSITFNREVGLILKGPRAKTARKRLRERFELDWTTKSQSIRPWLGL